MIQYVRSVETPVDKKKIVQTTLSQFVTPLKTSSQKKKSLRSTNLFLSSIPGYGEKWKHAMPGDLVFEFASDINHPAVGAGLIHRNYILVGAVKSFFKIRWDT